MIFFASTGGLFCELAPPTSVIECAASCPAMCGVQRHFITMDFRINNSLYMDWMLQWYNAITREFCTSHNACHLIAPILTVCRLAHARNIMGSARLAGSRLNAITISKEIMHL